jgi:hypothetical protein
MGAGGGVGEQEGDVAGAHVAAVDAVSRAGAALDPARDLDIGGAAGWAAQALPRPLPQAGGGS